MWHCLPYGPTPSLPLPTLSHTYIHSRTHTLHTSLRGHDLLKFSLDQDQCSGKGVEKLWTLLYWQSQTFSKAFNLKQSWNECERGNVCVGVDMNMREHELCVCVHAHTRAHRGGIGGWLHLCSGTVCLSPWRLLPHTLAFQKVTGIVYSTPSLGASQGAAGTCLSSGA